MKRKYRRIATSFRRTFFNVILMGEKSTSFWHTFFHVILMGENLTLFWHTLFDVISMTKKSTLFWPWSYNRNGNNMYKNSFIKVYWIRYGFEVERDSLLTKNRNVSYYQTTNLLKTRFLFLVSKKGEREDKRKFVTKFVGIIVTIIFM